ncbi:acyl-CoA thioesterase [Arthrobacter gengyunqii]|uniref:Acyl-CoA thioesterase n=1 Tax=Arthrobacter gengyunqii TaxID=2886940 RepID=A0A9X1M2X4_9MICC|nr:thioesterase family protein [Arthrobacter gengyunqii]MCC3270016.1 acyl-CoA thioesterase [Arthrobacter gengyunqii]UOY95062.1 acyl-CoA thioesterase [Arthrobacter gengyunqii]
MPMNRFPIQLRFGDEDSNGHVNNVRFIQFLEEARVRLSLLPLGAEISPAEPADTFRSVTSRTGMTLVAHQEIEYRAPLIYRQEPVWVEVWVTAIGGSSLTYGFRIADDDGGMVYALAESTLVMADAQTGRPTALSDVQIRVLESWRGDPVPFRRSTRSKANDGVSASAGVTR